MDHEDEIARIAGLHEDVRPSTYHLEQDTCLLGRSDRCQIIVARSIVSRVHAKIERDGHRYVLRDADSANGTFINSKRIREAYILHHLDEIGLGGPTPLLRFIDPDPTIKPMSVLRYDERALKFFLGTQALDLAPNQLRLLTHLYHHAGDVCTRESCAEAIWGRDYEPGSDASALDNVVARLRRQLRDVDANLDLIKTHKNLGFELAL